MSATHFNGPVVSQNGFAVGSNSGGAPNSTNVPSTVITAIIRGTVTVNPGLIATGAELDYAITVTGANVGDSVVMNPPAGGATSGLECDSVWVDSANTIKMRLRNNTGGGLTPASAVWNYLLIRS